MLSMPEDVFRLVITVAVVLACLAFVALAAVSWALYRSSRRMQRKAEPLMERVGPLVAKLDALADRGARIMDALVPAIEKAGPAIDEIRPALARIGPAVDKLVPVFDRAGEVLASAGRIIEDTRPRIAEISGELAEIVHTSRIQGERFGDTLTQAADRARGRIEQIDQSVESTIGQVNELGDAVKRAVTRPVREVNAVAAGFSAAISTLVRGSRRSSVATATQDEEMFI
ncbi:MAG: hypothetical protein ACLQVN_17625 [Bryobacteraceae bacterium]